MEEAYNRDNLVSHFRCFKTGADFVYTHKKKNDAVAVIEDFLNMVETRYKAIVRFFQINEKPILGGKYDKPVKSRRVNQLDSARDLSTQSFDSFIYNPVSPINRSTNRTTSTGSTDIPAASSSSPHQSQQISIYDQQDSILHSTTLYRSEQFTTQYPVSLGW